MDRLSVLRRIAPEVVELAERRHLVLQRIRSSQPVGRRALAVRLGWPERMVRKEMDFMRELGLVTADAAGMHLSPSGESVLDALGGVVRELRGLASLEAELARRLNLRDVIVVPGDSEHDESVKRELARATAAYLRQVLHDGMTLAVTGGTTLAEVARALPAAQKASDVTVVPARGGMGEEVELQANTVAAQIAARLGGSYRLLHIPDDLGEETLTSLSAEPKIKELLDLIKRADVVLHGVGTAEEMARRRGMGDEVVAQLERAHAVGEAFGYYFDARGDIIYSTSSVGLRLEDLSGVGLVIAVGGGHQKANAALAVLCTQHQHVFITDEGAARAMLAKMGVEVEAGP